MTQPTPLRSAVHGLCPRCGAKTLYAGIVRFAPHCRACALDYTGFNVGDGPAAFLTMIIGAIVTGLAIAVELGAHPPLWVHLVLWLPLTAVAVIVALRVAKGILLVLEYRNAAREGRIVDHRR